MKSSGPFPLGDVVLQSGATLWQAKPAYTTSRNSERRARQRGPDSDVLRRPPHRRRGDDDRRPRADPARGTSSCRTCSATACPRRRATRRRRSIAPPSRTSGDDNVVCQHRLVTEHLGVERIRLVAGFSMGAQQAFQWGALYPDMVRAIAPICGSARTSPHNLVFLEGVKAALTADAAFNDGWHRPRRVRADQASRPRLRRLGLLAGLLSRARIHEDGPRVDRGRAALFRGALPFARRERPARDAVDLAARRHQRESPLQRRPGRRAAGDHRARDRDAERHGSLLPRARQRAQREATAQRRASGPSRRSGDTPPGGAPTRRTISSSTPR